MKLRGAALGQGPHVLPNECEVYISEKIITLELEWIEKVNFKLLRGSEELRV
jgi:hypothetical protein